jgi:hypothetical protein
MMSDRRMALRAPGLPERPAREVREVLELRDGARQGRVDSPPAANSELMMSRQLELLRNFQQHWALYQAYCEFAPDGGSAFLPVEFQCVVDRDSNAIEEVLGIVAV